MTDPTREIDAPSLSITILWGDIALHTAHLDPIRSFSLGGAGADCVLPDEALGTLENVPLILAARGAIYVVLHPAMDPDGTVTSPRRGARTVADLARAGISEAAVDVPGAFLVRLDPGAVAALSIGGFTITITLETKAARAVARQLHGGPRLAPFQLGSAALHLALMGLGALFMAPPVDYREPASDEQVYFIQQALEHIEEKEEQAIAEGEGLDPDAERAPTARDYRWGASRGVSSSSLDYESWAAFDSASLSKGPRRADPLLANDMVGDDGVNAPIEARRDRYSMLPVEVDTSTYAAVRAALAHREIPAPTSIRPEAFLNSFDYGYKAPAPGATAPFAVHLAALPSPFDAGHHLLRIGVQAQRVDDRARVVVARKVKIQVDFDPRVVRTYRLLGFETRSGGEDGSRSFRLDGEKVLSGHSVTAVYDVVLASTTSSPVTVRIRYFDARWNARENESDFVMSPRDVAPTFAAAPRPLRLAAAAAGFAEILRKSPYAEAWHLADVERIAEAAAGPDPREQELVTLVHAARSLDEAPPPRAWAGRVADASLMGF